LQPGPCPVCSGEAGELDSGVRVKEETNYLEASAVDDRIKTVEQLKAAIELDEDEWVVVDSGYKKWDGFAKDKQGELHWTNGRLDHGDLYYNGIAVEQLFSVWIKCIRREPVVVVPTLKSVSINVHPGASGKSATSSGNVLVFADTHFGYEREIGSSVLSPMHDREFLSAVLTLAEETEPEEVHLLGDGLDLAPFSSFTQMPQHAFTLQPTLYEFAWFLGKLRIVLPRRSKIYYHEGNHEVRIARQLAKSIPELYGVKPVGVDFAAVSISSLLGLGEIGVEFVGGYPDTYREVDGIMLKHGDAVKQPGLTARHYLDNEVCSTVTAHVHRDEYASKPVYGLNGREEIRAYVVGCGCDVLGLVPARKGNNAWTQSMIVIHRDTFLPTVQNIPVVDGRFFYNGKRFTCPSYVKLLEEDIPEYRWR